jgi:hypothetical protein
MGSRKRKYTITEAERQRRSERAKRQVAEGQLRPFTRPSGSEVPPAGEDPRLQETLDSLRMRSDQVRLRLTPAERAQLRSEDLVDAKRIAAMSRARLEAEVLARLGRLTDPQAWWNAGPQR